MNLSLFYFLYSFSFKYQWLDTIIWFFGEPFIYITFAIVAVFLIFHYRIFHVKNTDKLLRHWGHPIVLILFSTASSFVISKVVKILVHTPRPFIEFSNVYPLFSETGFAFPSSHAATLAGLSFAVFFRHKRLGYFCLVAMVLVGVARVMAGVHFPIDILGGFAIGFLVAYFTKTL